MSKNFLTEWKKFKLNEAAKPPMDEDLNTPAGWFADFDQKFGLIQYDRKASDEWIDYVSERHPDWRQTVQKEKRIHGGNSYYLTQPPFDEEDMRELFQLKIKHYIKNSPRDFVEFFFSNMDSILDQLGDTKAEHSVAPTKVGGYRQMTDWYMFGDGFPIARQEFEAARVANPDLVGEPQEIQEPTQPDVPSEPVDDSRQRDMADLFKKFFGDK